MKNKPWIHILSTINGKYVYDVSKDMIISISDKLAEFLNDMSQVLEQDTQIEFEQLKKRGFFKESIVKNIKHPMSEYLELYQERNLSSVVLQVTQNCNLRCKYCIYTVDSGNGQRMHSNKKMSWEIAKEAIDFLWKHSVDSENITIGFYGGEPLLEKNLIKKCISYSKKRFAGKKLRFQMTTNATLLDAASLRYMMENNMYLMISIDGPKEIHDKNRVFANTQKGSFDSVIDKIHMIKEEFPEYINQISVNMVIDTDNDFDLMKKLTQKNGELEGIRINASFITNEYVDQNNVPSEKFILAYGYELFLTYMNMLERIEDSFVTPILSKCKSDDMEMERMMALSSELGQTSSPGGPCIPGKRFLIDVDGNFYPCERVSETQKCTSIGSLKRGFDVRQCDTILNIHRYNSESCKQCWAFRYCQTCIRVCSNGEDIKISEKNCRKIRNDVHEKMLEILLIREMREGIY